MKNFINTLAVILIVNSLYVVSSMLIKFETLVHYVTEVYVFPLNIVTVTSLLIQIGCFFTAYFLLKRKEVGRKLVQILSILFILNYLLGIQSYLDLNLATPLRIVFDLSIAIFYLVVFSLSSTKTYFNK